MTSSTPIAVIDACVLCSPLKRLIILSLAEAGVFRVRWSRSIMEETERAITIILTKNGHNDAAALASRAGLLINRVFTDALVCGYEHHAEGIGSLPDEGDRHVIAAAIETEADLIVTENLRDFPRKKLSKYGIQAVSSDAFIVGVIDEHCEIAVTTIQLLRERLKRPDKTTEIFLQDLRRTGLAKTVERLSEMTERL